MLDFLFNPNAVAVIGATEREGSVGRAVMENLRAFSGQVHPVNPKHATVLGLPSHPTISSVPGKVDLAVIVTPAAAVPAIIRECGAAGVRGAIILSAGFRETGPEGAALEARVRDEALRGGIRIVGPNCLGLMVPGCGLNATFAGAMARKGNIAFISQSGALCTAILGWSFRRNLGFSAFVSVGTMVDVGWGDLIDHLGDDPATKSIVIYMESIGDARSFLSAARLVALKKPIIVIKVGRTEGAASAVASHTGALMGSDEVLDAAFRRVGVLRVDTIEELFVLADVIAKQPTPRGPRLSIVTNAGGPGALAADALLGTGGQLAPISPSSLAGLNRLLPATWSHGNPIDILGDADPGRYVAGVEAAISDPESDGVLVVLTPQAMTDPLATAAAIRPYARVPGKTMLASWMGGTEVDAGRQVLTESGLPVFDYPDTAARAFSSMWQRSSNLRSLFELPALSSASDEGPAARDRAAAIIGAARKAGRTLLSEFEAKQVVSAYGIPTVDTRVALSEDEAVSAAARLGFPVAVKLHSESITHKTDVGGVCLGIADEGAVRGAWRSIESAVSAKAGRRHFLGVTVQRMFPRAGYELILGSSLDAQFGPVLMFGAGGELVEVLKDRAVTLPPLTANLARLLIERTRIHAALKGIRGRAPVDLPALEQILVRFSHLVAEHPAIKEIEINPLVVSDGQMTALDARVILFDRDVPDEKLPRLCIRPYPHQYVSAHTLTDGTHVTVRPIRAEDEPLMAQFHNSLSEASVYNRYFAPLKLEQRIDHERLSRLCFIDYDREMALVAECRDPVSGGRRIIGVGRLIKVPGTRTAEFALIVDDQWHRRGLGSRLLNSLVQVGRDERLETIVAEILPDNLAMRHVSRLSGFQIDHPAGQDTLSATLEL
jgi:acetyltransferase